MEEIPQNSEEIVSRPLHDENGKFAKGHEKLGGKALGTNNFETDFDEAVDEIAKENGITRSTARKLLLKVAYKNAKDGNYSFYKDIHDRLYGKAEDNLNVRGNLTIEFHSSLNADTAPTTGKDNPVQE